jgi:hypothetical protein
MKFITPAFVRIECPEKRQELIEYLEDIGYKKASKLDFVNCDKAIVCHANGSHYNLWSDSVNMNFPDDLLYNCGSNINLFKALAAMNDKNDYRQFFFHVENPKNWMISEVSILYEHQIWRKATAEEIVEHFKNN